MGMIIDAYRFVATAYIGWDAVSIGAGLTLSASGGLTNSDVTRPAGSAWLAARAALGRTSGTWYWEILLTNNFANNTIIGAFDGSPTMSTAQYPGFVSKSSGMRDIGSFNNGWTISAAGAIGGSDVTNTIYMFAADISNNKLWVGKDGTWFSSGNPAAGTSPWVTTNSNPIYPGIGFFNAGAARFRSLGSQMSYSVPSGFLPWAGG